MFVGRFGARQLAGFVINVVVALRGAINAVRPVQARVEPLRRIGRGTLAGQHMAHFVVIGLRIVLAGEISTFPTPIGPCTRQTVEHLPGGSFAAHDGTLSRDRAPQKLRHAFFSDLLHRRGHTRLAEIFLGDHVTCDLAPTGWHFDIVEFENDRTIRVADFGHCGHKIQICVCVLPGFGKFSFNFHVLRCLMSSIII